MPIKFYKNENGGYMLSDVKGKTHFIDKRVLYAGSVNDGKTALRVAGFASDRFEHVNGEFDTSSFVDAEGTVHTDETMTALLDGFFVSAGGNSGNVKLDFLLADAWEDVSGTYIPTQVVNGMVKIDSYSNESVKRIYNSILDEWIPVAGLGSDPYVPISQTTIFVHPTTFERYRFNGTEMYVYDDVDGVVPKWFYYKALLTQSGENAPVARVLNQDERDYLGDIEWQRSSIGYYMSKLKAEITLSMLVPQQRFATVGNTSGGISPDIWLEEAVDGTYIDIHTFDSGSDVDGYLSNTPIEIKQRLRGAPPKLLSAETNTTGDKVILTFDKKMSLYNLLNDTIGYSFDFSGMTGDEIIYWTVDGNKLIGTNDTYFALNGDVILLQLNQNNIPESFDYGLLQSFENFPVVNNVPA